MGPAEANMASMQANTRCQVRSLGGVMKSWSCYELGT
jgi:hypothetical protein